MGRIDYESETMIAHALRGEGFDASEDGTGRGTPIVPVGVTIHGTDKTAKVASLSDVSGALRARPPGGQENSSTTAVLSPVAFSCKDYGADAGETAPTLRAMGHDGSHANAGGQVAVTFDLNQITSVTNRSQPDPAVHHTLPATSCPPHLASPYAVRRLTPSECEKLQGFPSGWTRIPYRNKPADACPDGPRYKALGNSWATNCGQFVLDRIKAVEGIIQELVT
jgi:DNA (cytosine-5)-methyltransferase 1